MSKQRPTDSADFSDDDITTDPTRDDGAKDSTRLNWLEAQGQVQIYEWYPIDGASRYYELTDVEGTMFGKGDDLRAAIDDAMGSARP